jgi:replicative DNA helicase
MLPDTERQRERWAQVRDIVQRLKDVAAEFNLAALVLSQLNREVEPTQRPSAANLRDTGASEEHATNILMLWQSGPDAHPECWQEMTLEIEKQRNGPPHIHVPLEFLKSTGQFQTGQHQKGCCPHMTQSNSKQHGHNGYHEHD